jgi:hypothetical protein
VLPPHKLILGEIAIAVLRIQVCATTRRLSVSVPTALRLVTGLSNARKPSPGAAVGANTCV